MNETAPNSFYSLALYMKLHDYFGVLEFNNGALIFSSVRIKLGYSF